MQCPVCGRRFREARCPTHGVTTELAGPAPQPAPPDVPGYPILGVLGQGGFGTVFAASGRDGAVAIKIAHPGHAVAAARLRREAAALAAIGPPHVPRLHAAAELADGTFYVVMDRIDWPTLADRMCDRPPWPLVEVVPVAAGLARALAAAHALGLVHRDLKPENVFVADDGEAKLVDFGLVKNLGWAGDGLTMAGSIIGSTVYMSPEQAMGRADLDARSDVYSFGVILFEMLAGRPPHLGAHAADLLQAHIARRPPRLVTLASVPPAVDDIVHRCLAKSAADRPATLAEIVATLAGAAPIASPTAPARIAGSAPVGGPSREKRVVGLIFFQPSVDLATVNARLAELGAGLARADGRFAAVFDFEGGENPARRALLAAQSILEAGLAPRVVVDVAPVTVVPRPDGGRRYLSPLFSRDDSFAGGDDPAGLLCTERAAEIFRDLARRPVRAGLFHLVGTQPPASAREGEAPLVGRDAELAAVAASTAVALERAPTIVTVIGEAGSGKSRFLAVAAARMRAAHPDLDVVELRARDALGGAAASGLREVMRAVLELGDERPADGGVELIAGRLGFVVAEEVWAGVAVAMGWIASTDPRVRAVAAAPGALRSAAARALGMGLRLRAYRRPMALLLDDAHFAEPDLLDALEIATLGEAGSPLLVCIAARPALVEARPAWGERAGAHRRIDLGPLEPAAAGQLLRRLLEPAENIPSLLVDRLVERTRGVPLLIDELARGLLRDGLVRRHAHGEGWYLASDALEALPDLPLVDWLAGRELAWMPPDLARHARLLAHLGSDFTPAEVSGVLVELDRAGFGGELPLDAEIANAKLVERGLIVEAQGRLTYRSAVVRQAIERATPPALAQPIHEAAYRHYATSPERGARQALAHHAARCGRHAESLATYLALAEDAESRHAYVDAELFYGRALEQCGHGESEELRARLHRGRGLMRYRVARYDDALGDLAAAAAAARDPREAVAVALDQATVLDWLDEWRPSRDLVETARARAGELPGGPGPLLQARLTMALGRSACRFSEDEEAARLLGDAAAQAAALGDEGYETLVVSLLLGGYVLAVLGRLDEARRAFDQVIPLVAGRGDQLHLAAALGNRFMLWAAMGETDRMAADLQALLEIAREIGNPRLECGAHEMLAQHFHRLGRSQEAELHARRAIDVGDRRMGLAARLEPRVTLARVLAKRGELLAAGEVIAEIRARQAAASARGSSEAELVPLEEVQLAVAELLVRDAPAGEWAALEERARRYLSGRDLEEVVELAARRRTPRASP
jgi:tetratricopeptide (TPR) repeat protein